MNRLESIANIIQPPELEDFLKAHEKSNVSAIRLNPYKATNSELHPFSTFTIQQTIPWYPQGRILSERPIYALDPYWHSGGYYVQEPSSMILGYVIKHCLNLDQPLLALDLCAAPGGKTTLLADVLHEDSLVIANEVINSRATILSENIQRYGKENVWVTNNDPIDFNKSKLQFDLICIDAPCSGSGLFRKDKKALEEWSMNNVQLCHERQERILHDIMPCLRSQGYMIYMTCSYSQEENIEVVHKLTNEYDLNSITLPLEQFGFVEVIKSGVYGYQAYPHKLEGEGFFISILKRNGEGNNSNELQEINIKSIELPQQFQIDLLKVLDEGRIIGINESHKSYLSLWNRKPLRFIRRGIYIGNLVRDQLIPEHDIAMWHKFDYPHKIELTYDQALQYLRKETFTVHAEKAWLLAMYGGIHLGWIKNLGNRANNYYPTHLRLRLQ